VPKEGDNFRAGKMAELLAANGFNGINFFDKVKNCDRWRRHFDMNN